ncbi:MAG: DinB family protein, partial [Bacteroidota bacterium]
MSTPSLGEMLGIWRSVTKEADPYLEALAGENLPEQLPDKGQNVGQTLGDAMQRMIYHYWYHIGEIQAIRQMLGHTDLPEYVGDIEEEAPYRRE